VFEILKALITLQQACDETGHYLHWDIGGGDNVLRVEIQVTAEDREFVDQAREMFAKREN
jgi:hypothetical protein